MSVVTGQGLTAKMDPSFSSAAPKDTSVRDRYESSGLDLLLCILEADTLSDTQCGQQYPWAAKSVTV